MSRIKVSILLPVYGVECFIERCAVSLFEQTYENIEYIFVDDCTKDCSILVLKEVMNRYPFRKAQVRIIQHEVNKGVGESRNTLLDAATGDFFFFVDPDDYIDLDLVEKLVETQRLNNVDVVLYDYKELHKDGCNIKKAKTYSKVDEYVKELLCRSVAVGVVGKIIRTNLVRNYRIRVEGCVNTSEDYMIVVRAIYYAKSIATCNGSYYYYDKRNENSITSVRSPHKIKDDLLAIEYIENFFKDKQELYSSFQKGAYLMRRQHLIWSILNENKELFFVIKSQILKQSTKGHLSLNRYDKLLYRVPFLIVRLYVLFGVRLKKLKRKITLK